ncbi:MAG: Ppx/GppA phosphatase family protein [Candidatus Aquicultorales bacterium]
MKAAAIDVGTNSIRLLVVDTIGASRRDLYRSATITRLGEGTACSKRISEKAIGRTIDVAREYAGLVRDFGVPYVRAVATSAVRDAENKDRFVEEFREETGFSLEVLDGRQEAELTYKGAVEPGFEGRTLVVDVGGGSTEFVWGASGRIEGFDSVDVGSVRLTETFIGHDPPREEEISAVRQGIRALCGDAWERIASYGIEQAVGVAGTATTLAAVKLRLEVYDPEIVHKSGLSLGELREQIQTFSSILIEDRALIPGVQPGRADVILAGALILEETLSRTGLQNILISERDILDGLVLSVLER